MLSIGSIEKNIFLTHWYCYKYNNRRGKNELFEAIMHAMDNLRQHLS
jgi:hypothetical protein